MKVSTGERHAASLLVRGVDAFITVYVIPEDIRVLGEVERKTGLSMSSPCEAGIRVARTGVCSADLVRLQNLT